MHAYFSAALKRRQSAQFSIGDIRATRREGSTHAINE
jgi:hypothetical protein